MAEPFASKRAAICSALSGDWRSIADVARDARMSQVETLFHLEELIERGARIEDDGGGRRLIRFRLLPDTQKKVSREDRQEGKREF